MERGRQSGNSLRGRRAVHSASQSAAQSGRKSSRENKKETTLSESDLRGGAGPEVKRQQSCFFPSSGPTSPSVSAELRVQGLTQPVSASHATTPAGPITSCRTATPTWSSWTSDLLQPLYLQTPPAGHKRTSGPCGGTAADACQTMTGAPRADVPETTAQEGSRGRQLRPHASGLD